MKTIEVDREVLKSIVKSVKDALDKDGKIFKSCPFLPKFTADIDKQIRDLEGKLVSIGHSFPPHLVFPSSLEDQIMDLTNKIKGLNKEKEKVLRRVGELRSLITPQMDTLLGAQQDAVSALGKPMPSDLKGVEVHAYMFSALIYVLDCFLRRWNEYLKSLKVTYANSFKFM